MKFIILLSKIAKRPYHFIHNCKGGGREEGERGINIKVARETQPGVSIIVKLPERTKRYL